jgi:hypothetical protein
LGDGVYQGAVTLAFFRQLLPSWILPKQVRRVSVVLRAIGVGKKNGAIFGALDGSMSYI